MSKSGRIKGDMDDVEALLEIMNILKDVSSNRFFAFAQQKTDFSKFLELFLYFFDMLQFVETDCPLVKNDLSLQDILVITSEAGFMSQLNSRVCSTALKETEKFAEATVACVGMKGADKCRQLGMTVTKVFPSPEDHERYESALKIRDFIVERVMSGESGGCRVIYIWPKSFNILKPRVVKLLPAVELLKGDDEDASPTASKEMKKKDFINESSIDGIMKVLADLWVTSRLFEILTDTRLSEAATQAQQLEQAVESLGSEKKGLALSFKKASKDEMNKAMQEVFSASKMTRR